MSISRSETARIAALARLRLTDQELTDLTRDLDTIVEYMARIEALDPALRDGSAASGAAAAGHADSAPGPTPFREDEARPSLPQAEALRPARDHDDAFFHVPPVIEREESA